MFIFRQVRFRQVRFYGTDAQLKQSFQKSRISRVSVYDTRAKELITAVRMGNYQRAEFLVKDKVDVNGHDLGENTPLTDAAKRGDCKAIEFIIDKLKANPHASCDCPQHKTALHYASEHGHKSAVQMLLKLGANPNVRDSQDHKPGDLAKTDEIRFMLKSHESQYLLGSGLKFLN
jgi:Ankyrin repeats (3 copies)